MALISRWKLVWGPAIGLVVGPLIACLGIPAIFFVDARVCITGALLGLAIAYLYESLTRRHSHHELLTELSAIACAVTSVIAAVVRVMTPKRRWFRFSLATFLGIVTVVGLCAGWIGNNLYQVLERDELAIRLIDVERPRDLKWYPSLVVGPKLEPNVCVLAPVSTSDLQRLRAAYPEANIWGYIDVGPAKPYKVVLLAGRSIYQERALTDPEWAEDYSTH